MQIGRITLDRTGTGAASARLAGEMRARHANGRRILVRHHHAGGGRSGRAVLYAVADARGDNRENRETTAADTAIGVEGRRTAGSDQYHASVLGGESGDAAGFQFVSVSFCVLFYLL